MIFNIPVGGKHSVIVSVYGAPNEKVTITHEKGTEFSATTNADGYGGELEIPVGSYTVNGDVSKYSKTTTVNKNTKTVEAWPDTATIYYWYGYSPVGDWTGVSALPNTSPYTSNPIPPVLEPSTNSVYMRSGGNYARGGTCYLPITKIYGDTLHLVCSNAQNRHYLALSLTSSVSHGFTPTKVVDIATGDTEKTIDISAISGGSYYPAISFNTSGYSTGSQVSGLTVHALYSVGQAKDVVLKSASTKVATNDTYRYGSALQATSDFAKVSSLTFGAINYVGQGTSDYNSMMIPVPAFSFSGKSVWLRLSMWVMTSSSTNHKFRWAITTSRANEAVCKGFGSVTDENQLAQGTLSTIYNDGNFSWQTFLLDCESIPSGTPLYIYLWRDNTTYGNIHVMDNITVTLEYTE